MRFPFLENDPPIICVFFARRNGYIVCKPPPAAFAKKG
jgi:hypothetical protein